MDLHVLRLQLLGGELCIRVGGDDEGIDRAEGRNWRCILIRQQSHEINQPYQAITVVNAGLYTKTSPSYLPNLPKANY